MRLLVLNLTMLLGFALAPTAASLHECEDPILFFRIGLPDEWAAYVVYHYDPWVNEIWWGDASLVIESNGIPDLQFGGDNLVGDRAKCQMTHVPDTLVY